MKNLNKISVNIVENNININKTTKQYINSDIHSYVWIKLIRNQISLNTILNMNALLKFYGK